LCKIKAEAETASAATAEHGIKDAGDETTDREQREYLDCFRGVCS
jgi:hypothetical protein